MRILVEIIETPANQLGGRNRLTQKVRRGHYGVTMEMPSKLEAIKLLAQLAGWFAPKHEETAEDKFAAFARDFLDSLPQHQGLPT